MQLIRYLTHNPNLSQGTAITIGNFDGVHLGHQTALQFTTEIAQKFHLKSMLIGFEPYPQEFFSRNTPARLTKWREKWKLLTTFPLDYFCCLRFNQALADLPPKTFVESILVRKFNVQQLIVGQDFKFGAKRAGDVKLLESLGQRYHFTLTVMPEVKSQHKRISSSSIRQALGEDDLVHAQEMLGRPFSLSGHVVYGQKLGRKLGFPTLNINLNRKKTPVHGIYLVQVLGLKEYPLPGVANVGERPTIDGAGSTLLEVYLLNFSQEAYGKYVSVQFLKKVRPEARFSSLTELKHAISNDVKVAKNYFKLP